MRNISSCLLLGLAVSLAHAAHAQQPFERFGIKVKVATLSNGRYPEFFHNDSLRRVGSVVYNTHMHRIAYLLPADSLVGRAKPEVTSRWMSPDPLAEKFLYVSPYVFVENNPIRYCDPDGRELVDPNGKHVQVTYRKDGTLSFSRNATAAIRTIATDMNATKDGRAQLHNLTGSSVKVKLFMDNKVVETPTTITNGETVQGNTNAKDNYGKVVNPDGTYGLKTATITIHTGSIEKNIAEGSGSKLEGLTMDQAIGAVASHEAVHGTNKVEINKDLQYEQQHGGNPRPDSQREAKPRSVEQRVIDQSKTQ